MAPGIPVATPMSLPSALPGHAGQCGICVRLWPAGRLGRELLKGSAYRMSGSLSGCLLPQDYRGLQCLGWGKLARFTPRWGKGQGEMSRAKCRPLAFGVVMALSKEHFQLVIKSSYHCFLHLGIFKGLRLPILTLGTSEQAIESTAPVKTGQVVPYFKLGVFH